MAKRWPRPHCRGGHILKTGLIYKSILQLFRDSDHSPLSRGWPLCKGPTVFWSGKALTTRVCSFLGVQAENGTYLCGGHMGLNQRVDAAGTTIVYTNKRRNFKDSLTIDGPTTAPLKVMVSM